ncbi:Rib/alpha-like domain-containing protein [Staphylococcus simulans]
MGTTNPEVATSQPSNDKSQDSDLNNDSAQSNDELIKPAADSNNAQQQLTALDTANQQPVAAPNAQGETGLSNNPEVQQLAEQAGVKATDSPEVAMAKMLQQSSENKDKNTVQATTAQPTAMRRMMTYSAVQPQSTSSNTTTPTAQTIAAFASPSQGTTTPIVADAIANGYINSQTDATNAANTLSGRAWVVDKGTPATMSNGLTAVPEGTDVYMQWVDKDGAVSPVYTAKTTNELSKSEGSQVGPGAYAFDLREGWTDLNGKTHKYNASAGQDYRLWINDYQTANGNTATMLRQVGGFFPGAYVDSMTYSNLGQFPLAGTNMQRTGIFMAVKPTGGYMEKDAADQIHDTAGPISSPSVNLNAKNTVSGTVWLETGAGDYANSGTGPNDNAADPQAENYTVVMSSLTEEGAKAYNAAVNSLYEYERADAAKTLLEAHPEYISATVYGETDKDGRYTLRFPAGTLNDRYLYGYVKNPDGNVVNTYSSFTSPQFRAPNANGSWTPQTVPAQNLVVNPMWYNVNFAVVPTADITLDILKYNTTTTPAVPGSQIDIALPGTTMSPLPTHIEWRDANGNVIVKTDEFTTVEEGEQLGKFQVPTTAKAGDIYTAYLVTGGNDVSADSFIVRTYAEAYLPESSEVNNPYNTPTTEDQVVGNVTIPDYPADQEQPTITVDDPSLLPDGTTPGTVDVPVTVTYPDGTTDNITVPVTTASPLSDEYDPVAAPVNNPNGTPTTEDQVIGNVTIPDYPADQEQPVITVDDPSLLPDGTTPGTVDVPVTVTYPDGSTDQVTVPVTTGDTTASQYDPTTEPVETPYGTPTTETDVTDNVTVPNYPADQEQPTITVDDPTLLPDGSTPGTVDIPVTVTYPDGSQDKVIVNVTTGNPQADNYEPTTEPVENPYGTPTTETDVTDKVTVPNYPADQEQPTITIDDPTLLPDGTTPGTVDVPVTVTYPDGSTDQVTVPVTTGNPQADSYDPTAEPIENPYGTATTEKDVTDNVTVPNYPADQEQPTITVNDPTTLPDGTTPGTVDVEVTVTYPDGSTDQVTVPVTTASPLNDEYEPVAAPVNNPNGTPTTEDQVIGNVTVPNYPTDQEQPVITIDDPTLLPDGTTPGTVDVPVTVTYPDGTTDQVTVPVTTGDTDAAQYEPTTEPVENPYGTPTTETDVTDKVTVPNYPADQEQPTITVDDPTLLPDGTTPGTVDIPVTVTYPDGSQDKVIVNVTTGNPQADSYEPIAEAIEKPYGTPTTEKDVTDKVTVPNYPADQEQPVITVDDPSLLPDGTTPGLVDIPVTVTYPDGSQDKGIVNVTTGNPQADIYEPTVDPVNNPNGTPTTEKDVTDNVTVPNYPADQEQPVITVDDPSLLPDGSTDQVTVPVTTGDTIASQYEPTAEPVEKPYGTATNETDVTDNVTVPNYPADQERPVITVDDPTLLPDGLTPGTVEVPVTVTYPDGSQDKVIVNVTTGEDTSDTTAPDAPPINPIESGSTTVTGSGESGSTITVTYPDGSTSETTVDENGNWTTDVPEGTTLNDGDTVTATATDEAGNTSDPSTQEVTDTIAPDAPPINPIESGSTTVTGTGEPGSTITVTYPDGSTSETTVDENGNWTTDVPEGTTLTDGDTVTATATDEAGNTSEPSTQEVTDTIAPDAPEINGVKEGDTSVTGTGNPGDTITVTFPDGSTSEGTVDEDGNWTVDVPEGTTVKKGDVITATATDDAGNTSDASTVTVTGDNTTTPDDQVTVPDAPVINPVDSTDNEVTGTGTPGNEVTVTFPDGSSVTTTVDEDGNWTVDVPENVHLQDGDVITAVETDKDGHTSKTSSVTVTGEQNNVTPPADNDGDSTVVTPEPPVINEVPAGSPSVTGTGTPGHTVEVTFPDGHVETTTVNDQGSWSVQVPEGETLENGDIITAVDIDQSGNPSEVVRTTVGDKDNTEDALPDTGETGNANNATLFGGLFAALGSILLFRKRRKDNKDKQ